MTVNVTAAKIISGLTVLVAGVVLILKGDVQIGTALTVAGAADLGVSVVAS